MNNRINKKLSVRVKTYSRCRYLFPRNRQGGALLLGLIITMVIFGLLGGAMVYVLSSSSMDTVFGNFAQRAYYAAESGMRYAAAAYRKTNDHDIGKGVFTALNGRTLNFPDNGQAVLTITDSMAGMSSDVERTVAGSGAITINLAEDLTINDGTNFPLKSGFFRIDTGTTHYRYKTRNGNILEKITGPGTWPISVTGGTTKITAPQGQYSITSVGHYPSVGGVGLFRRTVEYGWVLSGLPAGGPPLPPPIDLSTLTGKLLTGSMDFQLAYPGGDEALVVAKDQGGVEAEAYVFVPPVTPNPFWTNWVASGGYSSYDLQVKIATGTLSGTTLTNPPTTYANGLTIRAINQGGQKQDFLGVSLVRNGMLLPPDTTVTPPAVYTVWALSTPYGVGDYVYENTSKAYYRCNIVHTSSSKNFSKDLAKWDPLSNANTPMIVLWRRDSNHANGDGSWLAYKILDEKSFIVAAATDTNPGHTIDWFTLLARIVEAASLEFSGTVTAQVNDIVIGETSGATGKVIKKIQTTSGNDVLLLNNLQGTFNSSESIVGLGAATFRERDNYIWVFYTDQADHSSNTTPLETTGVNNVRLGQLRNIANCCSINWPITDVQSWTAADDRFSLVNWNSNLNTDLFSTEYPSNTISIMGSGKEAGAIIRTDITSIGGFTRPGPYTVSTDFPGEIGLVSLGGENDAFFDDLAYRLTGGSNYGLEYIPPVMN